MKLKLYGISIEAERVTYSLLSPWRASMLEHRLFDSIRAISNVKYEEADAELLLHISAEKPAHESLLMIERIMKGWQEDGSSTKQERRLWHWSLEAEVDARGNDTSGDPTSIWGFLDVSVERFQASEQDKLDEVDLACFSMRIWPGT
ncbi:MAG: hypothetical protein R3B84_00015 [Zavarzinella sp.]